MSFTVSLQFFSGVGLGGSDIFRTFAGGFINWWSPIIKLVVTKSKSVVTNYRIGGHQIKKDGQKSWKSPC